MSGHNLALFIRTRLFSKENVTSHTQTSIKNNINACISFDFTQMSIHVTSVVLRRYLVVNTNVVSRVDREWDVDWDNFQWPHKCFPFQ
mmetsp:Transcript_9458/g.18101  ORF Transcript_9458/g.18101 Transcript_9458/m.18101 type:complete len:88 (+) Transcript_9458:142-405(+)